jgi:DNA processing protein
VSPAPAPGKVRKLAKGQRGYPERLSNLHDPPACIWLRGGAPASVLAGPAVAVVGARACSPYGAQVARSIGRDAAAAGVVVVSGLARGIDAEAHRGALEAGGCTVAVLGCGIDRDYPAAHAALAARIAENGLLVSEYPPGVEPAPWRFPARNRLIAALTSVTVIVEARERSGALITVDFALELGREVMAVPGEITSSLSRGTNALVRNGAPPLLDPADVLDVLQVPRQARPGGEVPPRLAGVMEAVRGGAASVDEIVTATGVPAAAVAAAVAELEVLGLLAGGDGRFRETGRPA